MKLHNTKKQIGLFGLGCVGKGLYDALENSDLPYEVNTIVVKDPKKKRNVPSALLSIERTSILANSEIDIIVEAIDDADEAFSLAKASLSLGIPFVSASKKMIAERLPELVFLQREFNTPVYHEAAVCGEIPILRHIEETGKEGIEAVRGIYNGTSNYILTQMEQRGISYDEALKEAQEQGFAESDPTSDVEGFDAAYKATILASYITGFPQQLDKTFRWGISTIQTKELRTAQASNSQLKLIAHTAFDGIRTSTYIAPTAINSKDNAYGIDNEQNVVEIIRNGKSEVLRGRGAGAEATTNAILSDLALLNAGGRGYRCVGLDQKTSCAIPQKTDLLPIELQLDLKINCDQDALTPLLPALKLNKLQIEGDRAYFEGSISLAALHRQKEYLLQQHASICLLPKRNDREVGVFEQVLQQAV